MSWPSGPLPAQQIVATDHLCTGVGKNGDGITRFLAQIARDLERVDVDRHRPDVGGPKVASCFSIPRDSRFQNGHQYPR
jgi:hypothetical protein